MNSDRRPWTELARRRLPLALAVQAALFASQAQGQHGGTESAIEEVFVLGRGETRQVQTVTAEEIQQLPPGTSALKAVASFPGVNFQSADPYGAYEWSARITIRGFNQNRLGFTLDGVPLGDMTYGNHNGLHISRALPTELVERIVLSQGTGALDTASASNLGGALEFYSAEPMEELSVNADQMLGSDSARRTFAKLESGALGRGTRMYLAVADGSTEKWKGGGDQEVEMVTAKLVHPLGAGGRLTAYYNNSDRAEIDYQDMSLDLIARRGRGWDNWYPNWNGAVAAAQACAASGFDDATVCDDAYWSASGLRKDDLGYVALELPIGDALEWTGNVYAHANDGQGLWGTPYVPTPGGAPLSIRTTEYDLDRRGIVTALSWTKGDHELTGGFWHETNDFVQARRFYGEPSLGAPVRSFQEFQENPFQTDWVYDFETDTTVLHLQDTWSISDALRLDFGFRSVRSENRAQTLVGPVKTGTIEADEPFLPQIGINYAVSDALEVFASAARNVRTFASSGTSGPFSTSAAGFEAIRDVVEPELATNYEGGVRFRRGDIEGLVALYHVDFENRLLGIPRGPSIVGNPAVLANVGSVKTSGIETALTWRASDNLSWFTSLAWNDSEYDDDYTVTDTNGIETVVPVSGKQVTDTPEILLKSELAYDNGSFFARAGANFTDERFYSYLNQGKVDSYVLLNLGVGYRFARRGALEELVLQADATNLTDKDYISTIDSAGFVVADPSGTAQTLLPGAPRQFFVSVKARF